MLDDKGLAPVHYATRRSDLKLLKFLVSKNADLNLYSKEGKTALHYAVESGDVSVINYLMTYVTFQPHYKLTPSRGADHTLQDHLGRSILHYAVTCERLLVFNYVLHDGRADPNVRDRAGQTPMHYIAKMTERCTMYIEAMFNLAPKVDIFAQDAQGLTALHIAAEWGNNQIIRRLLEHDLRLFSVKSHDNKTAQDHAKDKPLAYQYLLYYGQVAKMPGPMVHQNMFDLLLTRN